MNNHMRMMQQNQQRMHQQSMQRMQQNNMRIQQNNMRIQQQNMQRMQQNQQRLHQDAMKRHNDHFQRLREDQHRRDQQRHRDQMHRSMHNAGVPSGNAFSTGGTGTGAATLNINALSGNIFTARQTPTSQSLSWGGGQITQTGNPGGCLRYLGNFIAGGVFCIIGLSFTFAGLAELQYVGIPMLLVGIILLAIPVYNYFKNKNQATGRVVNPNLYTSQEDYAPPTVPQQAVVTPVPAASAPAVSTDNKNASTEWTDSQGHRWEELFDDEGDPYYHNHATGESLWEKPAGFGTPVPQLKQKPPTPSAPAEKIVGSDKIVGNTKITGGDKDVPVDDDLT